MSAAINQALRVRARDDAADDVDRDEHFELTLCATSPRCNVVTPADISALALSK